jgi:sugar/nucleoside kinase (ribokinase family)
MKKIITFGEILLRLSKDGSRRLTQGSTLCANYGGSEANVAVSLAQLGNRVAYVTRVPRNAMGEAALMHLRALGLDVRHAVRGGKRLGTYYFEPSAAMRSSHVVYDRDDSAFNTLQYGDINWEPVFEGYIVPLLGHHLCTQCGRAAPSTTTMDARCAWSHDSGHRAHLRQLITGLAMAVSRADQHASRYRNSCIYTPLSSSTRTSGMWPRGP